MQFEASFKDFLYSERADSSCGSRGIPCSLRSQLTNAIPIIFNHDFPELEMQFPHLVVLVDDALLFEKFIIFLLQLFSQVYDNVL